MNKKEAVKVWAEDGTISEGTRGNDSYLAICGSILSEELDSICDELNAEWIASDSGHRVGWSMGEFLKGFVEQRELPL